MAASRSAVSRPAGATAPRAGWAALRAAALAVSGARGASVFSELARLLATLLQVDLAFIARHDGDDPAQLQMLALYLDGQPQAGIRYPLAGTPCATVVGRGFRAYRTGLGEHFPLDAAFRALGLDSYAGYPLSDLDSTPLGIIAVASRRPLTRPQHAKAMLQIFAVRAAAEIERLRAEERLRHSEASYRALFDSAEDAIVIHDWDSGAVLDVNTKACETWGYSRDELRRLTVDDISSGVPPYTGEQAQRLIGLAKLGRCPPFEWHRRNRDGSLHWDEVRLKALVIQGRPHVVAYTREITERREREQALQRSEARLRATVEAAFDAVVAMDDEGRILEFNAAAQRCFGCRREEVLGRPLAELIVPPRHRAAFLQGLERWRGSAGAAFPGRLMEATALRADGSEFPVEVAVGVARVPEGSILVGHVRDIGERRAAEARRAELEAQLRQAQKMEAIGQLTGGIAHDFNNILTSVLGYVVMAAERAQVLGDATLVRQLGQAELAAQKARDLVAQMLTFARGQRGERRVLQPAPLVRQALQLLRPMLPPAIGLTGPPADIDAPVAADAVQLQQVLFNLCINARDAIAGAGRIRVGLRRCGGRWHCASCGARVARGDWVELRVADSGPGVAPAVMERMFDPFFSTKESGRGSGMGLAMVHGIVHEHGGHVRVQSRSGEGAVFRVLLPLSREAVAAAPEAAPAPGALPPAARVMVVEDEPLVGDYMAELLAGWGLEVVLQRDPLQAAQVLADRRQPLALLITDQAMPGLGGLELARRAAACRPGMPVLLYTGDPGPLDEAAVQAAGICAVLRKPVAPQALRALLRRLLAADEAERG